MCHSILVLRLINNEDRMTEVALITTSRTHHYMDRLCISVHQVTTYNVVTLFPSNRKDIALKRNIRIKVREREREREREY